MGLPLATQAEKLAPQDLQCVSNSVTCSLQCFPGQEDYSQG